MGSGGGGGGGGTNVNYVRYAPYVEDKHKSFLATVQSKRNALINSSPFSTYSQTDTSLAFFGSGNTMATFMPLFQMHETLLYDYDLDASYRTTFDNMMQSSQVKDLVTAEGKLLNDDVEQTALPRLMAGARDLNAVVSSSFVIAKGNVEAARTKQLGKFSAELRYRLIPIVVDRWKTKLTWNQQTVQMYAEMIKLYLSSDLDYTEQKYTMRAKNYLWPFTVLEFERAALGALQGAQNQSAVAGDSPSTASKAIGGALGGAAAGAIIGGPAGAIVGGGLGLASAFF